MSAQSSYELPAPEERVGSHLARGALKSVELSAEVAEPITAEEQAKEQAKLDAKKLEEAIANYQVTTQGPAPTAERPSPCPREGINGLGSFALRERTYGSPIF